MIQSLPSIDVSLPVDFVSDGEPIVPDATSVTWTVREANGSVVTGYSAKALTGSYSTQALLVVLAADNALAEEVKVRFVEVKYLYNALPHSLHFTYRLQSFVPLTVGARDVRAIFGVRVQELPDTDIDVYASYLSLLADYPGLAALLATSDHRAGQANRAVALHAALVVLPSMPVRALKEETLSNAGQIRASIDWEALGASLRSELALTLEVLALEATFSPDGNAIFLVATPIDVVTNA